MAAEEDGRDVAAPDDVDAVAEHDVPEPPPLHGVIVVKTTAPDGSIATDIVLNGDVRSTEVETLLKLGLRGWVQKIGV